MRIGVTGHQEREGLDWNWVRAEIGKIFDELPQARRALSSLAAGSDQMFAEVALEHGLSLIAVIPVDNYSSFFEPDDLANYQSLSRRATVMNLSLTDRPELAFLKAGRYIVDNCDLIVAIWDGRPSQGVGGTADVVAYALERARPITHIDPLSKLRKQL